MAEAPPTTRIAGLETLLKEAAVRGDAPVDRWDPPYCGDIGLVIRADGTWTYRDSPINRPELVRLFARVLRRDADGKTFLVTPAEKIDVHVEDAHFMAVEMEVRGSGPAQTIVFRTNVDDAVTAGPAHPLSFKNDPHGGVKPYLLVRGRLVALVSRALTYDLLEMLAEHDNQLGLHSDGAFFPLRDATMADMRNSQ